MGRRGFGSIRKLPSRNFQARYVGPDLRTHAAPHTFVDKPHAERWLVGEQDLISRDIWTPPEARLAKPKGLTVGEYVTKVIERRATRAREPLAPTTADLYRRDFRLRIADGLGGVLLAALSPATVADWWDGLDTSTRTQNGRAYELLKSVMAEAVDDELIPRNPCRVRGAGKPRPSHEGEALTVDEVLAYLEAVPERSRLGLMTAAWCGLRSGEVRGLRRRDVDLINGVLRIEQAVSRIRADAHRFEWRIAPPKTAAGRRTVAMPEVMIEPMREWLTSVPVTGRDGLLFPAGDHRSPMNGTVLREAHLKGRDAIGRPGLTIHDLRRTAATLAAQDGATIREVQRMLGHTTVAVAMVYQVASDVRDMDRAERLNAAITAATDG